MYSYKFFLHSLLLHVYYWMHNSIGWQKGQKSIYSIETEIITSTAWQKIRMRRKEFQQLEGENQSWLFTSWSFCQGGEEDCISTFLPYFKHKENNIQFIANKLVNHFLPVIDKLNKRSGTKGTYISFYFNYL